MEMPQKDLQAMEKVVLAGMKIMFDANTFKIFEKGLTNKQVPIPQRLATEAAGLMKMLYEKSKGKIPIQIILPASAMLLMEMGKFMKEAGIGSPTSEEMREATGILVKILKSMFDKEQAPQKAPAQAPQEQPQQAPEESPASPVEQAPPPAQPAPPPQSPGLLTRGVM